MFGWSAKAKAKAAAPRPGPSSPQASAPPRRVSSSYDVSDRQVASDGVFGVPIDREGEAPPILSKVLRYLLQKGVTTEGIFVTTPHATKEIQALKRQFKIERESVQISSYTKNPHVVAEVTKQFLQMLPEPLLTYDNYDSFLLLLRIQHHAERMAVAKQLISRLPNGFRSTVKQVLGLLSRIVAHADYTKVSAAQLAAVFGPIFLRAPRVHFREGDAPDIEALVRILITEYDAIVKNTKFQAMDPTGPPKSMAPRLPREGSIRYLPIAKTSKCRVPVLFLALHAKRTKCPAPEPEVVEEEEEEEEVAKEPTRPEGDSEAARLMHVAAVAASRTGEELKPEELEFATLAEDLETLAAEAARTKALESEKMETVMEEMGEAGSPLLHRSMLAAELPRNDSRDALPHVALEMVHQDSLTDVDSAGEADQLDMSENIDLTDSSDRL